MLVTAALRLGRSFVSVHEMQLDLLNGYVLPASALLNLQQLLLGDLVCMPENWVCMHA